MCRFLTARQGWPWRWPTRDAVARKDFHRDPFDQGTITKLKIFELYAREWLPVFTARPGRRAVHVFDFFAGPGTDGEGTPGSPLRLLEEMRTARRPAGGGGPRLHLHLFDAKQTNIDQLRQIVPPRAASIPDLDPPNIRQLRFHDALREYAGVLSDRGCAKLLLIDQFGVKQVPDDVFLQLVNFPTCDVLFFISSFTLHRFRDHPVIPQKIERPEDSYHVHRAVLSYYRSLLPRGREYWLAPFSIRKGGNIYGLIFGSSHPLGMAKFLHVAWIQDRTNGEADFDINRDNIVPGQLTLFGQRPTKLIAFEQDLENQIRTARVHNELDVIRICFDHGVLPSHSREVLAKLKRHGVIRLNFRAPNIDNRASPRPIRLASPSATTQ